MKFSTTQHTVTATPAGATQALSSDCSKVYIYAESAMDFNVVPGPEGTLTAALVTAAAVGVQEVRTVTTANSFGVGDVIRVTVDSNNVDYTVTSALSGVTASGLSGAINGNSTVSAIVTATVSGNVVTLTAATADTPFTLATSYVSRNVNHHIGANERLLVEVPAGSTIRAKASSGTLNISELT